MALVQALMPVGGWLWHKPSWLYTAITAARAQFLLLALSFLCLSWAFYTNDFSVLYVAQNSNSELPVAYRLAAVWGAHAGSILLWVLILSGWGLAVARSADRKMPASYVICVLSVLAFIGVGFLAFILFSSNPFVRHPLPPLDGADLNPLLQDPGLVIHPPILYLGYVGFAVAYAMAIAALLQQPPVQKWALWMRPWVASAWMFLTTGIALGSWWAYYELGWGGWWFWDPVENASFMPWLAGTALLHALAATARRGVFASWSILLAIVCFLLSLLGTFLVRSGVLTSVHAFASDPARGLFILALLALSGGIGIGLYAWRPPGGAAVTGRLLSRDGFLLINSALFTVALATVLLGTLYPLLLDALGMGKLSVGAPYFNAVFAPLMIPVAVLAGTGLLTRWQADHWPRLARLIGPMAVGAILVFVLVLAMFQGTIAMAVALALAAWIIGGTLRAVFLTQRRTPRFIGACTAHIGFAVVIIGIAVVSHAGAEANRRMEVGDTVTLAGYEFTLDEVSTDSGANYDAVRASFRVNHDGRLIARIMPEKRYYPVRGLTMTEAGIRPGLVRDLYIALGEPLEHGAWSVRLQYKPMVRWIWMGAGLIALGALIGLWPERSVRVPAEAR